MPSPQPRSASEPPNAPPRPTRGRRRGSLAVGGTVLAALALVLVFGSFAPTAGAAAPGGGARPLLGTASGAAPNDTWAWGAAANVSFDAVYVGAYNSSLNLTAGNLSMSGAFVAVNESVRVGFAAYAVIQATSPTTTSRYVEVRAVEARELAIALVASGTFPVAGTYGPTSPVPLATTSFSLTGREVVVQAYAAFLNFSTGANGSAALENEHVGAYEGLNLSLAEVNYPNVTAGPNGTETLTYQSAALSAQGYVAETFNASFTPALPVVEGPLSLGKSWNATSTVAFTGSAAYRAVVTFAANGARASQSASAVASVNATGPISVRFAVTNATSLRFPDGSTETVYVITASEGTSATQYPVWDGLFVLPAGDPTHAAGVAPAVHARPAAAPLAAPSGPATAAVVAPSTGLPVSVRASPSAGATVTGAPMTPQAAEAGLQHLGTPHPPSAPPVDGGPVGAVVLVAAVSVALALTAGFALGRRFRRSVP